MNTYIISDSQETLETKVQHTNQTLAQEIKFNIACLDTVPGQKDSSIDVFLLINHEQVVQSFLMCLPPAFYSEKDFFSKFPIEDV